jgi:hypothetical protein
MADANNLSKYIVAFAGAARSAQEQLSTTAQPMEIKEYRFKVSLAADIDATSDRDISLKVTSLSLHDKLVTDYKEHLGIQLECTLVPAPHLVVKG